ncbi:MAG: AAA family ATPase [Paeniclostridium sp.]|nr:AAA family ATPase [Paeniclostridium sp.]
MGFEIDVDNFNELMEYRKLYFHAFLKFKTSIEKIVEKYVDAIFNFTGNFGYTKNELLREVFMDEEVLDDIIFNLNTKKNIILQGPTGVGKTFIAKRICYFHQGNRDNSNIEMIQFHKNYTYEEFIRGYKKGKSGEVKKDELISQEIVEARKRIFTKKEGLLDDLILYLEKKAKDFVNSEVKAVQRNMMTMGIKI